MPMQISFGLAVLLLSVLAAPPARTAAGEPSLKWNGRTYKLSELPKEVAEAARPLAQWTERKGYRMELTPEADCLVIVSRKSSAPDEHFALVRQTLAAFDALIAPRVDTPATIGGGKPARGRLEDFDLPEIGQQEVEMPRLPHQVPVLLEARNAADFKSALEALVEACPWLADWAGETGDRANGLVLPRPLLGVWLVDAPGNEEWDPRNELVNRLAQLLLIDRGGSQPYWLLSGVAWDVELSVRKGIYCFPYRDGFVGIGEHAGWSPQLRAKFEPRAKEPPTAAEIASLERGEYVDSAAALAWGTAHWLLKEHAAQLPAILADLDLARRKHGIQVAEDGSWTAIEDWDWPPATLDEILRRHLGPDVFEELGAAFSAGL